MREPGPVLIRGISRSGTTLLATLLDAHPQLAMSYELYPKYMLDEQGGAIPLQAYLAAVDRLADGGKLESQRLRTFIRNCGRGGLGLDDLRDVLGRFQRAGGTLDRLEGRLRLIGHCAERKMEKAGKPRWGIKIGGGYDAYRGLWPACRFLYIVRDGRDVLASQLHTGNFLPDIAALAHEWRGKYRRFRELASTPGIDAMLVRYEDLAGDPAGVSRTLCEFIGLTFEPRMLEFHRQDLTIFKAPHLSREALSRPINATSIGRWQEELDAASSRRFVAIAGAEMRELGYLS